MVVVVSGARVLVVPGEVVEGVVEEGRVAGAVTGGAVAGVLPAAVHPPAIAADTNTTAVMRFRMYSHPTEHRRHLKGHGSKLFPLHSAAAGENSDHGDRDAPRIRYRGPVTTPGRDA
jgi:hypothetical protein